MRALTLTPEWAWAVCHLGKRVENRTWATPNALLGKLIALHAGKAAPDWDAVDLMAGCDRWQVDRLSHTYRKPGVTLTAPARAELVRGAIVATVRLVRCRVVSQADAVGWECGPYCWDLDDLRVLTRPVPCNGALGLWRLPDVLLDEVIRG